MGFRRGRLLAGYCNSDLAVLHTGRVSIAINAGNDSTLKVEQPARYSGSVNYGIELEERRALGGFKVAFVLVLMSILVMRGGLWCR